MATDGQQSPPSKLDPDAERLLAFEVARKAIRYLMVPAILFVTVAGFFGYDLRRDLLEAQRALVENTIPEAEARVDALREAQHELESLVASQNDQLTRQSGLFSEQLTTLIRQAESLGGALARMQVTEAAVADLNQNTVASSSEVDDMLRRLDAGLAEMELGRADLDAAREDLAESLDLIRERVFGSWSFVVHENRRTDLASLPLSVRMGNIDDETLEEFEVWANGSVVLEPGPVRVGESRCVASENGTWFRLTPSYIIELFLGDDVSGLQVERLGDRSECMAGSGG